MALKVCFPIQMLHTNGLGPRQLPVLKHLWYSGSADTALCTWIRNKRILGNSPAVKIFFCSFYKPQEQQHWGISPAAPNNSHSWDPSMWSLSCSFFNPDLYQTGKRHSVLGQDLLICPDKEAAGQVGGSGSLPEACQLTSCSKVNGIKKAQSRCTIWFSSFKFTLK